MAAVGPGHAAHARGDAPSVDSGGWMQVGTRSRRAIHAERRRRHLGRRRAGRDDVAHALAAAQVPGDASRGAHGGGRRPRMAVAPPGAAIWMLSVASAHETSESMS